LCDITSLHLLSDVLVQVLSLDIHQIKSIPTAFAMITDGTQEEDMLALHRCHRLHKDLKRAEKEKSFVLLTRLLSRHHGSKNNEEIVLELTMESKILFVDNDSVKKNNNMNEDSQSNTYSESWQYTLRLTLNEFSIKKEISSKIIDLIFPDLNNASILQKNVRASSISLIKALVSKTKKSVNYRDVILSLEQLSSNDNLIVHARGNIIQKLCCDVNPDELLHASSSTNIASCAYSLSELVFNLLYKMMEEEIVLIWTIQQSQISSIMKWECIDVRLPELMLTNSSRLRK